MAMNRIHVTLNDGTTVEVEKGTTIYEISRIYQPKMKYNIVGAKINYEIVPMDTKITKATKIEFVDLSSTDGYKINKYGYYMLFIYKFYYKNKSILFTGDIEKIAEKQIVEVYKENLKCDILKVAHHGSKTSSIREFLEYSIPKLALIGVGKDNKFGHPHLEVIKRLENMGVKIYRTDLNGEIEILIKNKELKMHTKNISSF